MISYASQDGYSYYLDPFKNRYYNMATPGHLYLIQGQEEFEIAPRQIFPYGKKATLQMQKEINKQLPSIPLDESARMVNNTYKIFEENTDIFDTFYKDNCELYKEVTGIARSIKKEHNPFF